MMYGKTITGTFLSRPNRFLAVVRVGEEDVVCHVKNTGRLRELLVPGAEVVLECHGNPKRKTPYSVIAVWYGDVLVNIDSQAPNQAAFEWAKSGAGGLFGAVTAVKREQRWGNSRFDLYLETEGGDGNVRRGFLEVKGVTLEQDGIARFPDAPTERGVKHVEELIQCCSAGFDATLLFVVQRKGISHVEPNRRTHEAFANVLKRASEQGVRILAFDCLVTETGMTLERQLEVKLV